MLFVPRTVVVIRTWFEQRLRNTCRSAAVGRWAAHRHAASTLILGGKCVERGKVVRERPRPPELQGSFID